MENQIFISRDLLIALAVSITALMGSSISVNAAIIFFTSYVLILLKSKVPMALKGGWYSAAFLIFIALQSGWVVVAMLSHFLGLPTLSLTAARGDSFELARHTGIAVLIGVIPLGFLLSAVPRVRQKQTVHQFNSPRRYKLIALVLVALITLYVNQGPPVQLLEGGYTGHSSVGNYWSGSIVFFIAGTAYLLTTSGNNKTLVWVSLNLIVFWWLGHGNRSEVLVLFILTNSLLFMSSLRGYRFRAIHLTLGFAALLSAFFLFDAIGHFRVSDNYNFPLTDVIGKDRIQIQTFGSSYYSVVASVSVVEDNGICWGCSILGQLKNLPPSFLPMPWDRYAGVEKLLHSLDTLGGPGLWGEFYLNLGLFGVILVSFLLALVLRKLLMLASRSLVAAIIVVAFITYSPRFVLYGYVYLLNLALFFVFVYFATLLLQTRTHRSSLKSRPSIGASSDSTQFPRSPDS